jgi:hypothetical protein
VLVDDALEPFEAGALEWKLRQAGDVGDLAGILALASLDDNLGDVGAILLEGDAGVDELALYLWLERVKARAAGGEDAANDDAFGNCLLDDRREGIAVVRLNDEAIELTRGDRVLELAVLPLRVELAIEGVDGGVHACGNFLDSFELCLSIGVRR